MEKRSHSCDTALGCGHACGGVVGEGKHLPCLKEDCPQHPKELDNEEEYCSVVSIHLERSEQSFFFFWGGVWFVAASLRLRVCLLCNCVCVLSAKLPLVSNTCCC